MKPETPKKSATVLKKASSWCYWALTRNPIFPGLNEYDFWFKASRFNLGLLKTSITVTTPRAAPSLRTTMTRRWTTGENLEVHGRYALGAVAGPGAIIAI